MRVLVSSPVFETKPPWLGSESTVSDYSSFRTVGCLIIGIQVGDENRIKSQTCEAYDRRYDNKYARDGLHRIPEVESLHTRSSHIYSVPSLLSPERGFLGEKRRLLLVLG